MKVKSVLRDVQILDDEVLRRENATKLYDREEKEEDGKCEGTRVLLRNRIDRIALD